MAQNLYNNPDSYSLLIQYSGDIAKDLENNPDVSVYVIDNIYAVISFKSERYMEVLNKIPNIVYVELAGIYTLTQITPVEASKARTFQTNPYLTLNGRGVLVGMIDTGIDYLNEEFTREDDTTRIIRIWDQTIQSGQDNGLITGTIYNEDDINKAIQAKINGQDPYQIVPSVDEIGHGTEMAGIIGARGKDKTLSGAAPDCTFAIVKLRQSPQVINDYFFSQGDVPKYRNVEIILGIKYLYELALQLNIPLVLYIPLGSTLGAHDGTNVVETYIDDIARSRGIIPVTSTGNQGDTDIHTQGTLSTSNSTDTIEINIPPEQKGLYIDIYIRKPDVVTLTLISPSGEVIDDINPKASNTSDVINPGLIYRFVFEGTQMNIIIFPINITNGRERIVIRASNLKPGIWQFRLNAKNASNISYDAWLLPRELLAENTRFLKSFPNKTLTIPGTSKRIITTSYYNQTNDAIVSRSGRGFVIEDYVKPIITAGGVDARTTKAGGGTVVVSGGSVAGAVLSGCIALLLQWGIVDGNDSRMYSETVQTYLIRGTTKREGDVYPNEQWGYGILNMEGVFNSLKSFRSTSEGLEYNMRNLFIRNPYI